MSDKEHFRRLCSLELRIEPNIVYARRLGTSSSANRVKPLLIALRTADEASILINQSKSVDRGTNVAMRSVFVNPNLSKDEAKAAYQERFRRRLAAQRRSGVSGLQDTNGVADGNVDPASGSGTMPLLNPAAVEFQPPVARTLSTSTCGSQD